MVARRATPRTAQLLVTGPSLFVDTNVFSYALDQADERKRTQAIRLIDEHRNDIVISTQVLIELYAVCTRKLGMERADARHAVEAITGFPVIATDRDLILNALYLSETADLSIFDATILSAAQHGNCNTLLTEDLNSGQRFGTVVVKNPFAR